MLLGEVAASGRAVCDRVHRHWPFSVLEILRSLYPRDPLKYWKLNLLINTVSLLVNHISLIVLESYCFYINLSLECWVGRAEAQSWSWCVSSISHPGKSFYLCQSLLWDCHTKAQRWITRFVRVFLNQLSSDLLCSEIVSALKHLGFVPLAPHKDFSCVYHENSWCSGWHSWTTVQTFAFIFLICFSLLLMFALMTSRINASKAMQWMNVSFQKEKLFLAVFCITEQLSLGFPRYNTELWPSFREISLLINYFYILFLDFFSDVWKTMTTRNAEQLWKNI